ncbi:hypothetical protein WDV93_04485 [Pantoea ananatis]
MIAAFRENNPGILFEIKVAGLQGVSELDTMAIMTWRCSSACTLSTGLRSRFRPAPVLLVMHQGHPLASAPQVTLSDMGQATIHRHYAAKHHGTTAVRAGKPYERQSD